MRLAEFILQEMEPIVAEWEHFATSLVPAATGMTSLALRDHAQQILEAVAADLQTPQTPHEQAEKSKGRAQAAHDAPETAAQTHAVLRAHGGFDIGQLVAEYRALRASVLRLWMEASPLDAAALPDLVRFNEAIDQAVAESVGHFQAEVDQARNLLLGMLGHDMRSPLATIQATATYLAALHAGQEVSVAAARLIRSGASMQALLDDLVDFNRAKLGLGLVVAADPCDLAATLGDELEQVRGAHPGCDLEFAASGETRGRWDGTRLQQLLRNLVSNALQYGEPRAPVRVVLRGGERDVRLEVVNRGPAIDPAELARLFDPLRRGSVGSHAPHARGGLGLGLYIVREIARAHGGDVEACCAAGETTFAVRLPRERREEPVPA